MIKEILRKTVAQLMTIVMVASLLSATTLPALAADNTYYCTLGETLTIGLDLIFPTTNLDVYCYLGYNFSDLNPGLSDNYGAATSDDLGEFTGRLSKYGEDIIDLVFEPGEETDPFNVTVYVLDDYANMVTKSLEFITLPADSDTGPTVTDANISIDGATGTGGAYKIGDAVTATWNNTAGGDNNGDTISGVTVDFSQFGGETSIAATNSGGAWTASYTITAGDIQAADRNISVTATDNESKATTTSDTTNATVDNIPPTASISSTLPATTNTSPINVTVTFGEGVTGFDVGDLTVGNGTAGNFVAVSDTTYTADITPSTQGAVMVGVAANAAQDAAGNFNTAAGQLIRTYDSTAPAIGIVSDGGLYDTTVAPTFNEGTATLSKDGGAPADFISGAAIAAEGSYVLVAEDEAGNSTTVSFVIDKTAPAVGGIADGTLYSTDKTVTFNEGTATLDGNLFTSGSTVSSEGSHTLIVTDAAGNSTTVSFVIDKTAPAVGGIADGTLYSSDKTVTFNEGTATLDGNPFTSGSTVSSEGSHTLIVTDAAGNSTTINFSIDKTAPTGTLSINGGSAITTSLDLTMSITSGDGAGSGVNEMRFSIDESSWSPWQAVDSTRSGTITADYGLVTVYMQLKDDAGNISGSITDTIAYKSQPAASNSTINGTEDTTVSFASDNFSFSNNDTTPMDKLKIKSLPSNGTLKLGGTAIIQEDEISAASLSQISFVPDINWNGSTGFGWVGYTADGLSTSEVTVTIILAADSDAEAVASDNTVSVSPGSVSKGAAATITASGSRQSEAGAVIGDEKYVPATWSSSEGGGKSGSFTLSGGTYTASYTPSAEGTYTITAVYQKMFWNGTAWENSATDLKTAEITVTAPSGGSGDSSDSSGGNSSVVEVNGEKQDAGRASTQTTGGQTVTTITVDDTKLNAILDQKGSNATVTLPVNTAADVVIGELNGRTVKNMEAKEAMLEIKTDTVTYTLPASQINIDEVSSQLGSQVELKDIKVSVKISEPPADTVKVFEDTAGRGNYQIVVKPVEFEITCTSGDKAIVVSRCNGYVERTIAIPDGVDPSKITTGVVLNADGTFRHVPTQIIVIGGKYYAKINSLTNSTYSVVYNPVIFADAAGHWAKDAINDMGSRMVVTGIGKGIYEPEGSITRAEFAAIIVRALGLQSGSAKSPFGDVTLTDWFNGYVDTATLYSLITGYGSARFAPNDTITREQAMTILARAMKLTGLSANLADSEVSALFAKYTDAGLVSDYAKAGAAACIKTGVVSGTTATTISPKDYVSRAEVAVMVRRLLEKSGLI